MGDTVKKFQDFVGKACVQHHIHKRHSRPFLQRNITAFLDANKRILSLLDRHKSDESNTELEMLLAHERPRSGWDYPTPKMLEELVLGSANAPALRINELQLRLIGGKNSATWKERRRDPEHLSEPSWLPRPGQEFTRSCFVEVIVRESDSTHEVFQASQKATITGSRDENDELFFDVKLNEPFKISLQQLFVAVSHGQTGQGGARWKRTTSKKYRLSVALKCNNSSDTAAFLSILESKHPSTYAHTRADEGIIKVDWSELPRCPKEGTLLELDRSFAENKTPLKYGMEINMGWGKPKGSVLQQYGQALHQQMPTLDAQQLPTPDVSETGKDKSHTRHTVRYEFDEGLTRRTFVAGNLKCLFCSGMSNARSAIDYPHISRLYLHYIREHEHFKFDLVQDDHFRDGHIARFVLSHNDKLGTNDDNTGYYKAETFGESHPYNIRQNWLAPRRPFDIDAYTAGDDSWTRDSYRPGKGKKATNSIKQSRAGASAAQPVKQAKRPALDEIQDLPPHKKRRYMVPDIPGVTFYHTSSKHPAQREDYFSEEDDELEEIRLLRSQRRNFTENGLDQDAIEFNEVFNAQMDREQSGPQILIRDGLVRFARAHRDRMNYAGARWRQLFEEKLNLLYSQQVIKQETVLFCLENVLSLVAKPPVNGHRETGHPLVNGSNSPARAHGVHFAMNGDHEDTSDSPQKRKTHKWSGGGADKDIINLGMNTYGLGGRGTQSSQSQTDSQLEIPETPEVAAQLGAYAHPSSSATSLLNGYPIDKGKSVDRGLTNGVHHPVHSRHKKPCTCGRVAESVNMRGIISCDNPLCGRDFHLTCVKLDRPVMGWRCPDCVAPFRKPDVPKMVNGTGVKPGNVVRPPHKQLAQGYSVPGPEG